MRLHGTVMPDQEQSAEHKLRDRYLFIGNRFVKWYEMLENPKIYREKHRCVHCLCSKFFSDEDKPDNKKECI